MKCAESSSWSRSSSPWHEVNGLFPDKYVHIGGDEVNGACWGGNATIRAYMKQHFGNESDYGALQAVFEAKVLAGNAKDGASLRCRRR